MENGLQTIDFGNIRPAGWIRDQMRKDLDGFVGHLDQLTPELMIDDKIYGEHRLTAKYQKQKCWQYAMITKKPGRLMFETELLDRLSEKKEMVSLIPVGKTILRQVSFVHENK